MKLKLMALVIAATAAAGGCTTAPQNALHGDFGNAVRTNIAVQVVNPEAGAVESPAAAADGLTAEKATDSYRKAKPEVKRENLLIQLGTGTGK